MCGEYCKIFYLTDIYTSVFLFLSSVRKALRHSSKEPETVSLIFLPGNKSEKNLISYCIQFLVRCKNGLHGGDL